jgi:hypothetical protein
MCREVDMGVRLLDFGLGRTMRHQKTDLDEPWVVRSPLLARGQKYTKTGTWRRGEKGGARVYKPLCSSTLPSFFIILPKSLVNQKPVYTSGWCVALFCTRNAFQNQARGLERAALHQVR